MSNYLIHYGVKGMKWGVRRYQNKDGSYTAEGRKRLGIGDKIRNTYNNASNSVKSKYSSLSDKQKKALKVGAGIAAGLLTAYASYKIADAINEKKSIALGNEAYARTRDMRATLMDMVNTGKVPEGWEHNASIHKQTYRSGAYKNVYRLGNQEVRRWDYRPNFLDDLGRARPNIDYGVKWTGPTGVEAFQEAYNNHRWKKPKEVVKQKLAYVRNRKG